MPRGINTPMSRAHHKCILLLLCLLLSATSALAQALSEKYYDENPQGLFDDILTAADTTLHYRSHIRQPIFEKLVRYGLSHVVYSRRGEESDSEVVRLGAHSILSPLEEWTDYNLLSVLRRAPMSGGYDTFHTGALHGADLRSEWFNPAPSLLPDSRTLKVNYAERGYRLGANYSAVGTLGEQWRYSMAVGARGGRDAHIEGIFSRQAYLWMSAERKMKEWTSIYGNMQSRLVVAFALAPVERSMRSWNTEEVFGLASNPLYNSSWGYQQGEVRSAKVRRELVPVLYGAWSVEDEFGIVGATLSAMVRGGRKARTALDWNEAASPLPDWYGYLPSGYDDPTLATEAEGVWRRGESNYTQIDWDKLYAINRRSPRGSVYALTEDQTDLFSAEVSLSGGEGGRRVENGKSLFVEGLFGGLTLGYHSQRNHSDIVDLLGGAYASEGFDGYDYTVERLGAELYESWTTSGDWGTIGVSGSLGGHTLRYRSPLTGINFALRNQTSAAFKTTWNYRLGPQGDLLAALHAEQRSPHHSNIIASPEDEATINPYARAEENYGLNLRGEWRRGRTRFSATLWANRTQHASATTLFWNDLDDTYSALVAGDMERYSVGIEADAGWYPTSEWSVEGALSLGTWKYASDAVADIVDTSSGTIQAQGMALHLKGLHTNSSPSVVAVVKTTYRPTRGWMFSLEGALAAGRWVEPSLLFCSDYLLGRNLSPEERTQLTTQHSLGTAPTLSAVVYRRVGRVGMSLSVRNLLGSSVKYDGYQPSRLSVTEKEYTLGYTPHPNKYQYSYPRHLYLTISYDF